MKRSWHDKAWGNFLAAGLFAACCAWRPLHAMAEGEALGPAEQMQFADGLYVRGLYRLAAEEYKSLLLAAEDFDDRDAALYRLAECLRREGRLPEARSYYRRLQAEYPSSRHRFRAGLRLAGTAVDAGDYEDAATRLEALLNDEPPEDIAAAASYELGYVYNRQGLTKKAKRHLRRTIETYPDSPITAYAVFQLAELLAIDAGNAQEALAYYERILHDTPDAHVERETRFRLAALLFEQGAYDQAAQAFDGLLARYPEDGRLNTMRLHAAWSFFHSGRFLDALHLTEKPSTEAADEWLYVRANSERQLLRNEAAKASYDRLLDDFPQSVFAEPARYERCLLAFRSGNYASVVRKAAEVSFGPEYEEEIHWLLAESHNALNQNDEAVQYYRLIIDRAPDGERAPRAFYRLAALLRERGEYQMASRMLRRLASAYPQHELAPQALLESGYMQARQSEYHEAVRDWSMLVENYPEAPHIEEGLFRRGIAEARLERDERALRAFDRLLSSFPASDFAVEALDWKGMLHARNQAWDEAEEAFEAALERHPDTSWKRRIRFHLATVLQQRGRDGEAATLLQNLVSTPSIEDMPPGLLEWLGRHQLEQESFPEAVAAGEALVRRTAEPGWRQIGWYLAGRAREKQGLYTEARISYARALEAEARTREGSESALFKGFLALQAGETEAARAAFTEAAQRADNDDLLIVRARALYGLGRSSEAEEDWPAAGRYYMSVAVLFDDPSLTPECLVRAADAFHRSGRQRESDDAMQELRQRFPDSHWLDREKQPDLAPQNRSP